MHPTSAIKHTSFFFFLMIRPPPKSTLFPYTTPFRSNCTRRTPTTHVRPDDPAARALRALSLVRAQVSVLRFQLLHARRGAPGERLPRPSRARSRSEKHTSELQSQSNLVCLLLLEKKK